MKKSTLIAFVFLLSISFCSKEASSPSEDANINSMELENDSEDFQTISKEELPEPIKNYIKFTYPNDFVGTTKKSEDSSIYEVSIRTPSLLNVEVTKTVQLDKTGNLLHQKSSHQTHLYEGLVECFDFNYPLDYSIDGTSYTATGRDNLNKQIKDWYLDNWHSSAIPQLNYPLDVIDDNGNKTTVQNRSELNDLFEKCYPGFYGWYHQACYSINYPITYQMDDNSFIEGDDWFDLHQKINEWYDENPDILVKPELVYPIQIIEADGTIIDIENKDELQEYFDNCRSRGNSLKWGWKNWNWTRYYEWYWEPCIRYAYPITYRLPNGEKITVENNRERWRELKNWYHNNPDVDEKPELEYPVTIIDIEGNKIVVTSEREMEEQYKSCHDKIEYWNWDWDWKWNWGYEGWDWNWGRCYTVQYPITFTLPDNSKITGSSRGDLLRKFKDWYDDHPESTQKPEINYPITLINNSGKTIQVDSKKAHEDIYLDCYPNWSDQWKDWAEKWKDWDHSWKNWNEIWDDWSSLWKDWWDNWWGKQGEEDN